MSFIVDLKQFVEADTSTNVYPMHIPQDASLPAIELSQISYGRDNDSNLSSSNIESYRMQITIVSKLTKTTLDLLQQITNLLEGYSGLMGNSNIMIVRVNATVPMYNKQQQTFEYAIDAEFKVLI